MGRSNPLLLYKCDKDDQGRGTTNKHSHTDHKRCTFVSQKFGAKEGHAGTWQTMCVYFAAVSAFFFVGGVWPVSFSFSFLHSETKRKDRSSGRRRDDETCAPEPDLSPPSPSLLRCPGFFSWHIRHTSLDAKLWFLQVGRGQTQSPLRNSYCPLGLLPLFGSMFGLARATAGSTPGRVTLHRNRPHTSLDAKFRFEQLASGQIQSPGRISGVCCCLSPPDPDADADADVVRFLGCDFLFGDAGTETGTGTRTGTGTSAAGGGGVADAAAASSSEAPSLPAVSVSSLVGVSVGVVGGPLKPKRGTNKNGRSKQR